jgi:hypothetical protein
MMGVSMENHKMKMTNKLAGLLLGSIVVSAVSLQAQPSASTAVQQQQNFQQSLQQQQPMVSLQRGSNAPALYEGEPNDVGPQVVLRTLPPRTYFMARIESEYLYSDNVLLTGSPKTAGTEFVNTAQVAFAPPAIKLGTGRFSPQVGVLSQWYNYGLGNHDLSAIDFNVQTFYVSGKYQLPQNWTVFGELDYNRFLSQANYDEFYHDFVPSAGVQRLFQVTDNSLFAVTLQGDYHDSWQVNPSHNAQDRADGIFSLAYAYEPTTKFAIQPYYRLQYTYYRYNTAHTSSRNDYLNTFGLSAAYYFTPNLSLRVFGEDNIRNSDDGLAKDYHAYNIGADLSYTFRF